jgi:hypothetical protein
VRQLDASLLGRRWWRARIQPAQSPTPTARQPRILPAQFEVENRVFHIWRGCCHANPKFPQGRVAAHHANVEVTAQPCSSLRSVARASRNGRPVMFIYPSSIAAYGLLLPDLRRQTPRAGRVQREEEYAHILRRRCMVQTSLYFAAGWALSLRSRRYKPAVRVRDCRASTSVACAFLPISPPPPRADLPAVTIPCGRHARTMRRRMIHDAAAKGDD